MKSFKNVCTIAGIEACFLLREIRLPDVKREKTADMKLNVLSAGLNTLEVGTAELLRLQGRVVVILEGRVSLHLLAIG